VAAVLRPARPPARMRVGHLSDAPPFLHVGT
jgi:hypothetical protein